MSNIELVIKIPEEIWEIVKNGYVPLGISKYLKNGKPLPKGHGDLIDRKYLIKDFKTSKKISFAERMDISCIVDHAPTILEADKAEGGDKE